MRSSALVLAAALVACGGKHNDAGHRCGETFAHLRSINVLPAISARMDALGFGMACKDLSDDDLTCVNGAKTPDGVKTCKHAGIALLAVIVDLRKVGPQSDGKAPDGAADLADAVCACKDEACLVSLGETRGDAIRRSGGGPNSGRLRDCIAAQQQQPQQPLPPSHPPL